MDFYNFPNIPEPKNYGKILEDRLSNIEAALSELTKVVKMQNEALESSIKLNTELSEKLQLLKPVNN